jgi:hypothetical protein
MMTGRVEGKEIKKSLLLHETTLNRRLCNLMMSRFTRAKTILRSSVKSSWFLIKHFVSLFTRRQLHVSRISSGVQQRRRRSLTHPKFRVELFSMCMSGKSTVVLLITQRVFGSLRLRPFLGKFLLLLSSKKISSSSTNRHH